MKLAIKGSICGFRLNDNHVISLTEAIIRSNIQLIDISLSYHRITDIGFEEIARLLQPGLYGDARNSHQLEGLDLEGNDITGDCFAATSLTTAYDCPLSYLNLTGNPLSTDGRNALADVVLVNKTLRQLAVNNCGFDLKSAIHLITNLHNNNSLQLLYFDRPMLLQYTKEDELSDHISRLLEQSKVLCDISLRYCNIQNHGAKLLADALIRNATLINLNLECNKIGISGAEVLASYLMVRSQNTVKSLGLSFNFIGDDGAIAIAEAIKCNTSLCHLSLKNNNIGPIGLKAIADALECNSTLESISIFGNNFNDDNGKQFHEFIRNVVPYTALYLDIDVYVVDGNYNIAEN